MYALGHFLTLQEECSNQFLLRGVAESYCVNLRYKRLSELDKARYYKEKEKRTPFTQRSSEGCGAWHKNQTYRSSRKKVLLIGGVEALAVGGPTISQAGSEEEQDVNTEIR